MAASLAQHHLRFAVHWLMWCYAVHYLERKNIHKSPDIFIIMVSGASTNPLISTHFRMVTLISCLKCDCVTQPPTTYPPCIMTGILLDIFIS